MSHRGDHGPPAVVPTQRFTCTSRAASATWAIRSARAASECMIRKFAVSWTCQPPAVAGAGVRAAPFAALARAGPDGAATAALRAGTWTDAGGSSGAEPRTTTVFCDARACEADERSETRLRRYSPYQLLG